MEHSAAVRAEKEIYLELGTASRGDYRFRTTLIVNPFSVEPCPPEIQKRRLHRDLKGDLYKSNFHVETLGTLTLEQSDCLIHTHPDYHVTDRSVCWRKTGKHTMEGRPVKAATPPALQVPVDYPLNSPALLTIPPFIRRVVSKFEDEPEQTNETVIMSSGYLLWILAGFYKQVYESEESQDRYGVWGHGINDLYFEGFVVGKGNEVQLLMGS